MKFVGENSCERSRVEEASKILKVAVQICERSRAEIEDQGGRNSDCKERRECFSQLSEELQRKCCP